MKKYFVLISAIFFAGVLFAQDKTSLTIEKINSTLLKPGDKITVPVYLQSPEKDLSSFQLYLKYDQEVLTYQKIDNVNPLIKDKWYDNHTPNFIAGLYLDDKRVGIHFDGYSHLFDVEFIYNGGQTDIKWDTESKIEDGVMYDGITKFTVIDNKVDVPLELNNGCVCPLK